MGEATVKSRNVHFSVVAHSAIIQIAGANRGPVVVNNRHFGMDVDGAIMLAAILLPVGAGAQTKSLQASLFNGLGSFITQSFQGLIGEGTTDVRVIRQNKAHDGPTS